MTTIVARHIPKAHLHDLIQPFIQKDQTFYYLESLTTYELNPIAHLKNTEAFQTLRIFNREEELHIKKLHAGYHYTHIQSQQVEGALSLVETEQTTVLLDPNYVTPYQQLQLVVLHNEDIGYITRWKEVN